VPLLWLLVARLSVLACSPLLCALQLEEAHARIAELEAELAALKSGL
jgi:hypothetical protein